MTAAISSIAAPTQASQVIRRFDQAEQLSPSGKPLVEESTINVVSCSGAGENGGQYYIYQYHKRAGFRAIKPPNWAQAIGGRDWPTFEQAAAAACRSGRGPQPSTPVTPTPIPPSTPPKPSAPTNLSGRWSLDTNCGFIKPPWKATIVLSEAADGSLTASTANDPLNATYVAPGDPEAMNSTMKSQVRGAQFNLLLHPKGWASVLEFTGTVSGSVIKGKIHHYTQDDCTFTMSRLP